jgi:hypothetical protein
MKILKLLLTFFIAFILVSSSDKTKAQSVEVNFSVFQQNLSPYGRWKFNPLFGQVWVYEDPDFRPYATDGHWEYTNYGWSWVSDFEWGWAPFHYGRWEHDSLDGWMWLPGYQWASAWVSWSQQDGYYGWAPLGYGAGINISFGAIPYDRWNFIPRQYMGSQDFYRHYASLRNNYFRNSVVINNFYNGRDGRFNRGPERNEVERFTNNRIEERHVNYRERTAINRHDNGDQRNNNFATNQNQNYDRNQNNGNNRNQNSPIRQPDNFPDTRDRNNDNYNRRRNENRQQPDKQPVNTNPGDNNQNENYPGRSYNNIERPRQQNRLQPLLGLQELPQRDMQQRQQQLVPQPQQRIERPNGGVYSEGRQRAEQENNQRSPSQGRESRSRKPGRD